MFATHLHELATLPPRAGVRLAHLRVHYDAETDRLIYDRDMAPGAGSALYGLEVCRALDLPVDFLERARAIRQGLAGAEAAVTSAYRTGGAAAVRDQCAVCGSAAQLEMHHIQHQAAGGGHTAGNQVCLCAKCHDAHHAGTLTILGWEETSTGRRLVWSAAAASAGLSDEVREWVRDQRRQKIRIATIQRMARQIFGVEMSDKEIRAIK